jgi:hypothetical protein
MELKEFMHTNVSSIIDALNDVTWVLVVLRSDEKIMHLVKYDELLFSNRQNRYVPNGPVQSIENFSACGHKNGGTFSHLGRYSHYILQAIDDYDYLDFVPLKSICLNCITEFDKNPTKYNYAYNADKTGISPSIRLRRLDVN